MDEGNSYKSYQLTFPVDLDAGRVMAWLHTVVGTLLAGSAGLFTLPTIVLEVVASERGLQHQLRVPRERADDFVRPLRALMPGITVTPSVSLVDRSWTEAVELGTRSLGTRLNALSSEHLTAGLLSSLQGLRRGEVVVLQWVLGPARGQNPTIKGSVGVAETFGFHVGSGDHKVKQSVKPEPPDLLGVLRVAAEAESGSRARQLLGQVRAALGSAINMGTRITKRPSISKDALGRRLVEGSGLLLFPARISIPELVGLIGWPIGSPHVAGLQQGRTRQLDAPASVPREGRVIGTSNFPGAERPVALSYKDATKHLHVLGPTGVGKTTLLANMAAQDMAQGYGVIVLESKGDLFNACIDRVPRSRFSDVIVCDFGDTNWPVGMNVLSTGRGADELAALIIGMYGDNGVYTPMLLHFGLRALAETPGMTFIDLPALLTPQGPEEVAWRDSLVANLKNRDVRQFWQRYLSDSRKDQDRMTAPVHNRIWQLAVRPEIRNIIGQSTSSFTFEEVLQNNKILLINLNGVRVGEQTAGLVGTLLMNALWSAVRTVKKKRPSFLYLDEFQDFINLPVPAADMLAKLRSFELGLVLAHQDLDQLAKVRGLEQAVLANARSKVVFQTSARDARTMQREFGRLVTEDDFINLGGFEAIVRIATDTGVSSPFTITTAPPSRTTNIAEAVKAASRTKYGRPVAEVEVEIDARRHATTENTTKPKLGTQRWG
ncbi:type IV secretion system DNA-binding domain-containing protein [Lentzea aerocolonigenes]|uniref:type IV secretion system DNA-binding domain-containing protein n=1 Tax=Lentzea aerocolonigenes TaxID=68170 RepID=UPI0004C2F314|nr:type IV secretion system DNA-binding domain-containing protein [Lentzea aerocolonigenes]MCP2245736.1 AAA-like domain-containing protein [Lentzea aerocolonigenes]